MSPPPDATSPPDATTQPPDPAGQPPRRYASQVRDEQARRTRRAIVTAAHDLFLGQGYAATTIDGIAEAAHVSRRTVFNSVGGKAALLKLAFDWAIVGDDEPVALADRPGVKAIVAEPDPRQALRVYGRTTIDRGPYPTKDEAYYHGHWYSARAPGLALFSLPFYETINALQAPRVARSSPALRGEDEMIDFVGWWGSVLP